MADINYNDHASKAAPTVDDFIPIWDVAAGQSKKATIANILNARLTGGGIVATGGFTLTVPATGTAALRGAAQSFTATQTFAPSGTGSNAIDINMPASTSSDAIRILYNGTQVGFIRARADNSNITLSARDLGNNIPGPNFVANRNTNAGTEGPSPGTYIMVQANGTSRVIWADNSGLLRIHTAQPTGSTGSPTTNITAGTVVGDQSSWIELKENVEPVEDNDALLERVLALPLFNFQLIDEAPHSDGGKTQYTGLIITHEDREGKAWFAQNLDDPQAVPALNERSLFGHLIGAIQALNARIEALEAA